MILFLFPYRVIVDLANSPDVVDTVLVGFRQRFDVSGRDGIEQQDLSLFTGHGEHRPAAQQIQKSYWLNEAKDALGNKSLDSLNVNTI